MNWEKSHNIEPIQKWKGNIVTYVYKNKKKHEEVNLDDDLL